MTIAVALNIMLFPQWSGLVGGKRHWGESSTQKLKGYTSIFSMDFIRDIVNSSLAFDSSDDLDDWSSANGDDQRVDRGSSEDSMSSLSNDEIISPYYDQVFVWDVPSNETIFENNMYYQWCRWRNGKQGSPEALTMDLHKIQGYSNPQVAKPLLSLIHLQMHCGDMMRENSMGTGNVVQLMYLLRIASAGTFPPEGLTRNAFDIQFSCTDDDIVDASKSLVLPWLTGRFSSWNTRNFLDVYWNHSSHRRVIEYNCKEGGWGKVPVGWMVPFIRHDLRLMAIQLVGLPQNDDTHPAYAWLERQRQQQLSTYTSENNYTVTDSRISQATQDDVPVHPTEFTEVPMIPNVELDDTAIHFRCGDVMTSKHAQFRFLKYKEYAQRIDSTTKSIGIITQPFPDSKATDIQARTVDLDDPYRVALCRAVVEGFANYLQERFPNARVSIRNGPEEPVALAFARLIMARQSFASADSSFALFPTLASFGVGYHLYPISRPYATGIKNQFLMDIAPHLERNDAQVNYTDGTLKFMHIPSEEALYADKTLAMRRENQSKAFRDIVRWFRDDDFDVTK